MKGIIFDIKEFSIHDGPGARITVFMKGCPLSCIWCHNPEGLKKESQLLYKKSICTHCGSCRRKCDHLDCKPFGRCIHACVNGCLSISGRKISSDELAAKLLENKDFFEMTGGGVTVSGGEPMLQGEFVRELADKLDGVNKAIQTSGYTSKENYISVINKFDFIMQDIKLVDRSFHRKYTGVYNDAILNNIEYLKKSGKKFVFRVPLIPDITDNEKNLTAISEIVGDCPVELLSYNRLAGAKYDMLDMEYELGDRENRNCNFTRYFENAIMR